ncbi:MAG: hypothetical protein C0481_03690 [Phenylobacterium sp.]|uniref:peptidoglycan-binding domain-containing protein n=1 Tax=Phenylobacterium sp. TaxID=1871053 RepID=UPI0025FC93B6|nr:peptidoglycan-binding domain-containing protein [Phenylobacterium sp.]MBA4010945.1 hypothetical protein [Phenylobacterium sp.]
MAEITITHELLRLLAERTCFTVPERGLVFFGFRGLLPLDVTGTDFSSGHRARLVTPDNQHMRCTLGQWRPENGVLALFPGSTVPNLKAIQSARASGGIGANMLMLGRYGYDRGVHKAGKPTGHRAFRQGMFFPVWRNADDLDFDLADRLDISGRVPDQYPWDNLHCAYHDNVDTPAFSSNGCQVVAGRPTMPANGNLPESGPWARFVANAYGVDASGQAHFPYLLFSGTEAGLVSAKPQSSLTRSLRFGSQGEWVTAVQNALRTNGFPFLEADGDFGRDTLESVMGFQAETFGASQADGVVGPNTAGALQIPWPPIATTLAAATPTVRSGATVAGVPGEWLTSAVEITPGFEVRGDPYLGVSDDFDEMGISCGALQWNIGSNSLQPMVRATGKDVVMSAMPTLGADLWRACEKETGVRAALAIVRGWQPNKKLPTTALTELARLMGTTEMRAQQQLRISAVGERALTAATKWAANCGRNTPSKREFLWFFDLTTQNGGLEGLSPRDINAFIAQNSSTGAADAVCEFLAGLSGPSGHIKDAHKNAELWRTTPNGLPLELLVLSYLRSASAVPKWRHVVLNRKGAIATGGGWVNSERYDFSTALNT